MREQEIYIEALDREDPDERHRFLDEVCGDDSALRERLNKLLRHQIEIGSFLENTQPTLSDDNPLSQIGPYKIREQIGEGGMGVVYVAEQMEPVRRKVALKLIKPGMDTREVIARFESERQTLALMDHPGVAKVLDAGSTESGRPYFVMELVHGVPITDFCDDQRLPTRERLQLLVDVCRAVQHAHQKGIIHRDLKPSNVMITMHDDIPVVKVIDFGVSKALNQQLTEKTLYTAYGQMIGTPLYMSPEQAQMSGLDVDTRSDVYSLGVLLYELLTSTSPFDSESFKKVGLDEMRRIIREDEPPRPSARISTLKAEDLSTASDRRCADPRKFSQSLRGELDWIVMKALEKNRTRRYESASALARDIGRYLNEEPIEARPPSRAYRVRKLVQRNRGPVLTAVLVMAVLVGGIIATAWQALVATEQRNQKEQARSEAVSNEQKALALATVAQQQRALATRQRDVARENLYVAHIRLAHQDWDFGDIGRMLQVLEAHHPKQGEPDLRGWEWYYLQSLCHKEIRTLGGHAGVVRAVNWSPDGARIASGNSDNTVKIWDARSGQEITTLRGHSGDVYSIDWSPDGRKLASGGHAGEIYIWDALNGKKLLTISRKWAIVYSLEWSPDGRFIASAPWDGELLVHDALTGKEVFKLPGDRFRTVAWSPDGDRLATGGSFEDSTVCIWDSENQKLLHTFRGHERGVNAIAFSPDGRRVASAAWDEKVKVWDLDSAEMLFDFAEHAGNVHSLAWSPRGEQLASAGADRTIRVWDIKAGKLTRSIRGHRSITYAVSWSEDGQIASGSADKTIRIWNPDLDQEALALNAERVAWSPDGEQIVTRGDTRRQLKIVNVVNGLVSGTLSSPESWLRSIAWSPDRQRLAAASSEGDLIVWDVTTEQEILRLKAHTVDKGATEARSVSWSPDGRMLATCGMDKKVKLWEATTGRLVRSMPHRDFVGSVAWSPDGKWLASASWDQDVIVWEVETGRKELNFHRHTDSAPSISDGQYSIAWSPSGKRLAAGSSLGHIVVWDLATAAEVLRMRGHTANIRSVAWSPDGRRLVSTGEDRLVKIWDAKSGDELLTLREHRQTQGIVGSVAWSPDGKWLASEGGGRLLVRDASAGYEIRQ